MLWGDAAGMRDLRDFLRSIQNGIGPTALNHFCKAADGKDITVKVISSRRDAGMRLTSEGLGWSLRPEAAEDFAELVDALVSSPAGHQYLDCGSDEITVMVSTGEYPASLHPDRPASK